MWTTTKFIVTFSKCKSDAPTLDLSRNQGTNNIIFTLMCKPQLKNETNLPVTDIDYYFPETNVTKPPTFTESFVRDIRDFRCLFITRTNFCPC